MSIFGSALGASKATPASFHTQAAPMNGGGQSRNTPASPMNVGQMAKAAQKVVSDTASGAVKGVKLMGKVAGAFGRNVTGQDEFTKSVVRQAPATKAMLQKGGYKY